MMLLCSMLLLHSSILRCSPVCTRVFENKSSWSLSLLGFIVLLILNCIYFSLVWNSLLHCKCFLNWRFEFIGFVSWMTSCFSFSNVKSQMLLLTRGQEFKPTVHFSQRQFGHSETADKTPPNDHSKCIVLKNVMFRNLWFCNLGHNNNNNKICCNYVRQILKQPGRKNC